MAFAAPLDAAQVTSHGPVLRAAPLLGYLSIRNTYTADRNELNRITHLYFERDVSTTGYGIAARAGWAWTREPSSWVAAGLAYTHARGLTTAFTRSTGLDEYRFELEPRYDSAALWCEVVAVGGAVGVELTLGTGRVDAHPTALLEVTTTRKNGYQVGTALRARLLQLHPIAIGVGAHVEVLGFSPLPLFERWTRGALAGLRIELEFDGLRALEPLP